MNCVKKMPTPRRQSGAMSGKRDLQKNYAPQSNIYAKQIPLKFDVKIYRKFAKQFKGTLLGDLAAERLQSFGSPRGGSQ